MSEFFPKVTRWILTEKAFTDSVNEVAKDGRNGNEGIVLWLGHRREQTASVTHLVVPDGPGIIKTPVYLSISPQLVNEITDVAVKVESSLVGQAHSHGRGFGVDLSRSDRLNGINVPWYLSVVIPDYGLRSVNRVSDCGVHVYEPQRGYRRLFAGEATASFVLSPGPALPVLRVST